jgi:hypothetical protein
LFDLGFNITGHRPSSLLAWPAAGKITRLLNLNLIHVLDLELSAQFSLFNSSGYVDN